MKIYTFPNHLMNKMKLRPSSSLKKIFQEKLDNSAYDNLLAKYTSTRESLRCNFFLCQSQVLGYQQTPSSSLA